MYPVTRRRFQLDLHVASNEESSASTNLPETFSNHRSDCSDGESELEDGSDSSVDDTDDDPAAMMRNSTQQNTICQRLNALTFPNCVSGGIVQRPRRNRMKLGTIGTGEEGAPLTVNALILSNCLFGQILRRWTP